MEKIDKIDKKRHLAKTLTWRILATTDTFLIAWIITGKVDWATGIAGIEVLTKMILYYWHALIIKKKSNRMVLV